MNDVAACAANEVVLRTNEVEASPQMMLRFAQTEGILIKSTIRIIGVAEHVLKKL